MTTWLNAPDASGLWWVRREGQPDDVLRVTRLDERAVWISGTLCTPDMTRGWQWCRVAAPDRVEALESALREVCEAYRSRLDPDGYNWCRRCLAHWTGEAHAHGCPVGRALAVLRGATVAGERGSR